VVDDIGINIVARSSIAEVDDMAINIVAGSMDGR
jgi:hypothetical protein